MDKSAHAIAPSKEIPVIGKDQHVASLEVVPQLHPGRRYMKLIGSKHLHFQFYNPPNHHISNMCENQLVGKVLRLDPCDNDPWVSYAFTELVLDQVEG